MQMSFIYIKSKKQKNKKKHNDLLQWDSTLLPVCSVYTYLYDLIPKPDLSNHCAIGELLKAAFTWANLLIDKYNFNIITIKHFPIKSFVSFSYKNIVFPSFPLSRGKGFQKYLKRNVSPQMWGNYSLYFYSVVLEYSCRK